jgi:hypothetical protein
MGETLRQGEHISRFALNAGRHGGGGGGGRAQRDLLPLSGSGPAPQRYTVVAEVSPDGAAGTPSTSTVLLECLRGLRYLLSADSMNEHRVVDIAHSKVALQFAPTSVVWHAQGPHGRVKVR